MWAAAIALSSTAAATVQPPRAVRPALVAVQGRAVARGRRKVPLVPGQFDEEQQAAHAATRAAEARASGGHGAGVRETLGHKYWCDVCSRGFDRVKQQAEHEAGKRHLAAVDASEGYWLEYCASAWFEPAEADADEELLRTVVTGAWSLDAFVEGLPRRSRSRGSSSNPAKVLGGGSTDGIIDPHVTLSALSPFKRARLWRYLRDLIPSHPALPEAVARLEASQPRFARVKELLESCEAFLHAERAALAAGAGDEDAARPILDLACGHGLVGALLAYRFPHRPVLAVDIAQRPAQAAWSHALGDGGALRAGGRVFAGGEHGRGGRRGQRCRGPRPARAGARHTRLQRGQPPGHRDGAASRRGVARAALLPAGGAVRRRQGQAARRGALLAPVRRDGRAVRGAARRVYRLQDLEARHRDHRRRRRGEINKQFGLSPHTTLYLSSEKRETFIEPCTNTVIPIEKPNAYYSYTLPHTRLATRRRFQQLI